MRLFGVMMVRNEADIIEASVRHNLSVLDGLTVLDHGSLDGTADILSELQKEGLALKVATDRNPGFFQAEQVTMAAREILASERADFVFPIDAVEFIKVQSRERLDEALGRVPQAAHALASWLTYVPDFAVTRSDRVGPSHLRRRLKQERHRTCKSIIGRSFMRPTQYVVSGSHLVDDPVHMRIKLRYPAKDVPDTLRLLMLFVETLLDDRNGSRAPLMSASREAPHVHDGNERPPGGNDRHR